MGRVELIKAVGDRLDSDATLTGFIQDINFRRNPDEPSKLNKPLVVFNYFGGPDTEGLHGAALDPELEVRIWGYGNAMAKNAERAAERISELLLSSFSLSDGSQAFKFRSVIGWQDTPQPDPKTIMLLNRYSSRLWAQNRIDAIGSQ